ncbi:GDP-mannose 4,6-dehydratase [Pengzhenrongella sicca]|uniref:GDP-mannose 4,6-dehydratase n=1 Tax=Pengzhenrongella sicca TaxID=2819238 RepID=A0A8A4ZE45_9MICO|nr:GDP-mannose 4,6-dehydratase [Pengzhenrongella sicca]QTE30242.1 GDP-mannose 4,6-dehydratase [Pengzhenrongella sicca]
MGIAFVTGATGQDGSYLCEALAREGAEVHALVRRGPGGAQDPGLDELLTWVPGLIVHEGDLADAATVDRLVAEIAPDEIYNLAGISSVAYSWAHPVTTGIVSGVAVASVLHSAWLLQERTGRTVRVLQASSAEIFGDAPESPQTEATPVRPRSPYGAAKAYAHHMVGVYRARELHASAAILYNHESPRRPEAFVTRKITRGAARIAAGLDTVLTLGTLDVTRDWGWAPDYVQAMTSIVRHEAADDFVIATGVGHTVADFVRVAFARVGIEDWQAHVRTDPAFVRPADAAIQLGDASKARRELGWSPSTAFEQIVASMVDHDVELIADGGRGTPA